MAGVTCGFKWNFLITLESLDNNFLKLCHYVGSSSFWAIVTWHFLFKSPNSKSTYVALCGSPFSSVRFCMSRASTVCGSPRSSVHTLHVLTIHSHPTVTNEWLHSWLIFLVHLPVRKHLLSIKHHTWHKQSPVILALKHLSGCIFSSEWLALAWS